MKNIDFTLNSGPSKMDEQTETIMDNYFNIRFSLFNNKLKELQNRDIDFDGLTTYSYYKEIAKINMNFGRQTGHSFFQHWLLNHCTSIGKKCLHISHKLGMLIYFKSNHNPTGDKFTYNTRNVTYIDNHKLTVHSKDMTIVRGVDYVDYVIVDTSDLYKTHQINSIIKNVIELKPKLILYM